MTWTGFLLSLLAVTAATAIDEEPVSKLCHTPELYDDYPMLCRHLDRVATEPDQLAKDIYQWASQQKLLVGANFENKARSAPKASSGEGQLPVVFAHGMGDSCFNSGMQHIGEHTSDLLGNVYVTCVPTGDSQSEDTTNGYFLNMDASVDIFAQKIREDPKLAGGFHAIGFSQGNNVIRGYISRYNDPPVDTFVSVNGVNGGVGAVPYCRKQAVHGENGNTLDAFGKGMCDLLMEQASRKAYTEFAQTHSFQANYWRDPRPSEKQAYAQYSQLARWNNEGQFNQTLKDNYAKTKKFVWVMATEDGMVWPREGEQWGAADPKDPFNLPILPMKETEWYQKDLFGLKTADDAGKNFFEEFDGDHLQFNMDDFDKWVTTYLYLSNGQNAQHSHTNDSENQASWVLQSVMAA